ncbi:replication factor C large subunit [Candidatus Woesearchaeota archaeon]|nr:replication factor C large subunit [Candidatus Woesearchaeota archaeon]
MQLWTKKHTPKNSKETTYNSAAVEELKNFINDCKGGCALIYGPTGCGKTSAVYALANETDYEVLELNASDFRNKAAIESIIGNAAKQMSLFKKGKILLIDEIDNLSGTKDRGGAQALAKIISESAWPVILTANNPDVEKLKNLKKKSTLISFEGVETNCAYNVLKKICEAEKIIFDEEELKKIANNCGGDLRGAINDLQSLCEGKKRLEKGDASVLGERDYERKLNEALTIVMKSRNVKDVLGVFDQVDVDIDEIILWEDENLPREYVAEDLAGAYESLSRADVFRGRIRRWQHWRFLVYIYGLLSVGVALAKKEKNKTFLSYKRSSRILKLWIAKNRNAKKLAIAGKIAKKTHRSKKKVIQQDIPYLKKVFENEQGGEIAKELELNEEEIEWLSNSS